MNCPFHPSREGRKFSIMKIRIDIIAALITVCALAIIGVSLTSGIQMVVSWPATAIVMLVLAFGMIAFSTMQVTLEKVEAVLKKERNKLDSPLKLRVKIPKVFGKNWYATVYMDRRTGKLSAPEDAEERVLELETEELRQSQDVFGAPYYKQVTLTGADVDFSGLQVLTKVYTFPGLYN